MATELKIKGNEAVKEKKYKEAVKFYTEAIQIDSSNHVLYSNRSAAYANMKLYEEALKDGEKTISLKPDWAKGYSRKGAALEYLKRYKDASDCYEIGLNRNHGNDLLQNALDDCQSKMDAQKNQSGYPYMRGAGTNPFGDPNLMAKLALDPRTKDYINDPEYLMLIKELQEKPDSFTSKINDKRVLDTLSVVLGLDLASAEPVVEEPKAPPKMEEDMEVDLSHDEKEALTEKELGNSAYKSKKFCEAIIHYDKAIELNPMNATFYTNKAAVYFEKMDFEECIKQCELAVDIGRQNRADFKLIAKSLTRIGNAYKSLKDYEKSKIYYEKSLSEHRTPETRSLLSKVCDLMKEQQRKAYINPELAEEQRQNGNDCFKKGDYPSAIKFYTEAIERNPEDFKIFSNRAACYTKLAEFNLGLKDCEQCIKLDPTFVKGYIRKGKILQGLKQNTKAKEAYQKALTIDDKNKEAMDGIRACYVADNGDPEQIRKQAMDDPEVQQILKDPAMMIILEQMQNDPRALQDHLKNPEIAVKIHKLIQSGLISIR